MQLASAAAVVEHSSVMEAFGHGTADPSLAGRVSSAFCKRRLRPALLLVLLSLCALIVVGLAIATRAVPARCPAGRSPLGHRCCWDAQHLEAGYCVGAAQRCASPQSEEGAACFVKKRLILVSGGELRLAPNDWQAQGQVSARVVTLASFSIDNTEATVNEAPEPELPRRGVSAQAAEQYCEQRGGRLPTVDEWLFAAAGSEGRRFPWGQTGLVCRRAVYGLEQGPCADTGRAGPDAVGTRPAGATANGIFDLVGNVAEWARDGERYVAMGGSFRSRLASQLKVWSREATSGSRDDIGFRCVYSARD
jgi:formylglycine-generating enzyme